MSSDKAKGTVGKQWDIKTCLTCIINQFVEKANMQLKIFSIQHSDTCPGLPTIIIEYVFKEETKLC